MFDGELRGKLDELNEQLFDQYYDQFPGDARMKLGGRVHAQLVPRLRQIDRQLKVELKREEDNV